MNEVEALQEMHDDEAKHAKAYDAENWTKPRGNSPIAYPSSSMSPPPSSDSCL